MAISSGARGTASQQQDRRNQADRDRARNGGSSGERGTLGQQQDRRNFEKAKKTGLDAPGVGKAVDAYVDRVRDYEDEGNTTVENAGNMLAGLAGFSELDPEYDPENLNTRADWGFDVAAAVAGAVGLGLGIPGLGLAVGAAEDLLGQPATVNLGQDALVPDEEDDLGGAGSYAGEEEGTAGSAAAMGGGGLPDANGPLDDEMIPERDVVAKPPKPKKPKPYSNVQLGDVTSVLDMLGY